ncbi:Flagellum-specific peptidoglycan hydrolase FlgJ [Pilibacter termitis]|uniref:Flagellum-specific peptidoglycan hydrolase FlgJ n=1 Tax=Pilibacter termitis TaxID=263852 RepID=A0A1T4PAG1_9ENTE|nr:Flagellum-specific peptidoglycan hydrolase FlgJ [Pilibacter termitis]
MKRKLLLSTVVGVGLLCGTQLANANAINDYIVKKGFQPVAEKKNVQLPKEGYKYNYAAGYGKPEFVIIHETANSTSTINGEINYMLNNWSNAFVHEFVDDNNMINIANTDYLSWGAGPVGNRYGVQVEQVRVHSKDAFAKELNNLAKWTSNQLIAFNLGSAVGPGNKGVNLYAGKATVISHADVSSLLGGTNHGDPIGYWNTSAKSWFGTTYTMDDFRALVNRYYNRDKLKNGDFIKGKYTATVYLYLNNSKIPLSSWNQVGGPKPVKEVSEAYVNSISNNISNGTFIREYGSTGTVYQVVGGVKIPLSNWSQVGGQKPYIDVPRGSIDKLPTTTDKIANGTFIREYGSTGTVYQVVGGVKIPLSNWNQVGGQKPTTDVAKGSISKLPTTTDKIANGTFIREYGSTGTVYQVVGGVKIPLSNWNQVGGQKPTTDVAKGSISKLPTTTDKIANGTFIREYGSTGTVYQVVGGVKIPLSNWNQVGGQKPTTDVAKGSINNLPTTTDKIANGTFIREYGSTGTVYQVVGGVKIPLSNWNQVGGQKPTTDVAKGVIAIMSTTADKMRDNTFVREYGKAVPFYLIKAGKKHPFSSWNQVGGQKAFTDIPVGVLRNLPIGQISPPATQPTLNLEGVGSTQQAWIKSFAPQAATLAKKNDIFPSIMLAQATLESGWGQSELAKNANNFFGIKAAGDPKWTGAVYGVKTAEVADRDKTITNWEGKQQSVKKGETYYIRADFRKFGSVSDGQQGYISKMGVARYAKVKRSQSKTYQNAAKELVNAGYATDPAYAKKLVDVIEKYKFYIYD